MGVGRSVADLLSARGHDITTVDEIDPRAGDDDILRMSCEENRILITLDKDFGTLIFSEGLPHKGVVRLPNVPCVLRMAMLEKVLERHGKDLESHAIITVKSDKIRVSKKPEEVPGRTRKKRE